MATQQAWDDVENLIHYLQDVQNECSACLRLKLSLIKSLLDALAADQPRLAEAVAHADQHPIYNSTKLAELSGKYLQLNDWLIANGYYS